MARSAAVLRTEVNLDELPNEAPSRLRQVLSVCLQRDPRQRVHDIADVRLAMEGAFETSAAASSPEPMPAPRLQVWQRPIPAALVGLLLLVVGGLAVWTLVGSEMATPRVERFTVSLSLIRFGGHLSKGEYDGHHGRQPGAADAAELHGRLQDRRGAPGPR